MIEDLQFVNEVVKEFIIYIILGLAAIVGGLVRRKYNSNSNKFDDFVTDNNNKMRKMQKCLDNQNERGIRLSKSQMDIAEYLEDETIRLHPNQKVTKIKDRITRNLQDKFGNL